MRESTTAEDDSGAETGRGEICEVDYEVLKRGGLLAAQWRFVAWASDASGRRALARSPIVFGHTPELWRSLGGVKALDALVTLVSEAGWSAALPRGQYWYSLRFGRSSKASAPTEPGRK